MNKGHEAQQVPVLWACKEESAITPTCLPSREPSRCRSQDEPMSQGHLFPGPVLIKQIVASVILGIQVKERNLWLEPSYKTVVGFWLRRGRQ